MNMTNLTTSVLLTRIINFVLSGADPDVDKTGNCLIHFIIISNLFFQLKHRKFGNLF